MITDKKLVERAEKLAKSTKSDAHPDLVARVESFKRAQDSGGSDLAVQAHAKALVDAAAVLGEPADEEQPRRRTAKKAASRRPRG